MQVLRRCAFVLPLVLVACAGEESESQFAPQEVRSIPAGSFGGRCVEGADTNGVGTLGGDTCGMSYGGRGTALSVRAAVVAVRLGDSGELPASGGKRSLDVVDANVANIVEAKLLSGATRSEGVATSANASIAQVRVDAAGHVVTAAVLQSNARASCGSSAGGSLVTDLRIDNVTVNVTGAPNQTIAVGPVRIVINEQLRGSGSIVVHALHVSATSLVDVAIASSRASVVCPCGASSTPSDGDGAGGGGSSGSGGDGSGGDGSGGDGSGGGGGSSGGGTSDQAGDFGAMGDACDDQNKCASGNRCVPGPDVR